MTESGAPPDESGGAPRRQRAPHPLANRQTTFSFRTTAISSMTPKAARH